MKRFGFTVIIFAVLLFITPSSPSSPSMEEIEGTLEIIMATETGGQKTCKAIYYVNAGGKNAIFLTCQRAALVARPENKNLRPMGR